MAAGFFSNPVTRGSKHAELLRTSSSMATDRLLERRQAALQTLRDRAVEFEPAHLAEIENATTIRNLPRIQVASLHSPPMGVMVV